MELRDFPKEEPKGVREPEHPEKTRTEFIFRIIALVIHYQGTVRSIYLTFLAF